MVYFLDFWAQRIFLLGHIAPQAEQTLSAFVFTWQSIPLLKFSGDRISGNDDVSYADVFNHNAFPAMLAFLANLYPVNVDCFHVSRVGLYCANLEGFPGGAIGSLVGDGECGVGDCDRVVETGADKGDG